MTAQPDTTDQTIANDALLTSAQEAYSACRDAILRRASFRLRALRGYEKEEAMAEVEAFAWKAFRKLTEQGRDPTQLVSPIVDFSAGRVKQGRRFAGKIHRKDALAEHRESVEIGDAEPRNREPNPASEAITNVDWEAFLATLEGPQREVAEGLASGLNLTEVAQKRGTSKTAASLVRDKLAKKWDEREGGAYER